jgi:hypothetical protein
LHLTNDPGKIARLASNERKAQPIGAANAGRSSRFQSGASGPAWLASAFGDMKDPLTAFQLEVEKGINDVLDHLGKHVVDRRIAGIAETYITGSVSNQDIIFWIYPDGAALQVGRRQRAFGFPTREPLLDTAGEFLDEFMKVVTGPDAAARH